MSLFNLMIQMLIPLESLSQTTPRKNASPAIWATLSPVKLTHKIIHHWRGEGHGSSTFCLPPFPQNLLEAFSTMPKPNLSLCSVHILWESDHHTLFKSPSFFNEVSQTDLYVESKKIKQMYITEQKQTHIYREQTGGYQWAAGGRSKMG